MFAMNPAGSLDSNESVASVLVSVVGNYTLDALLDSEQRRQHKELCAERLAAQDNVEVQYAEQAVLANLDWGIDALEEAILTSNEETKKARLEHAERMLQVSALLNIHHTTAGVPNSYLSAWAHLNLAFVWKLRNDDRNAAAHMLEMFLVEPLYSRVDFAPSLWEHLFLPHLTSIVAWYTEQRHSILSSILPDGTDFSLSREDLSYNVSEYKNFLSTVSPEQAAQLQQLEQLYQDSLDENTRLYARYYKDWLNFDPAVTAKRSMPLMPIAEPPMTPMHELSHIPQSVKFGPQPPTSAGFSHSNFGFSTVYTNSSQQATMFGEHEGRQEDLYNRTHGNQSLNWEEDEESGEPEYGAHGNTYNMDLQMTEKHTALNKKSSGGSLFRQQSQGNMYNPSDLPYGQKIDILKQQSPKERNASPAKAQNPVIQNSKLSRHHEASHRRTGSSKPLLALFQDQDAVMVSSLQSSPAVEEHPSSSESGLKVQEALQEEEKDFEENTMVSRGAYITSREEKEEAITNEEDGEFQEDDDEEQHDLQIKEVEEKAEENAQMQGETSSSPASHTKDPRQSLSQLKLPEISTPVTRPPKDFVCPITSQIFNDPVTLETGQTYERRAIQEWLNRGNTTCPITRQTLRSISLPKTNYVLKRVIASWKEHHPELALEFGSSENSPCLPRTQHNSLGSTTPYDQAMPEASGSPYSSVSSDSSSSNTKQRHTQKFNSRSAGSLSSPITSISQDVLKGLINELKPAVACICSSDDLQECESAVLTVAHIWQESKGIQAIQVHLVQGGVIKGFVEVLSTSNVSEVLEAAVFILSELIERDESVAQLIAAEDSEYDCVVGLLKRNMLNSTVLLYQLRPTSSQLAFSDLLPSLVGVLRKCENEYAPCEEPYPMFLGPKEAASLMIHQMLAAEDQNTKPTIAHSIISMDGVSPLVDSLEATSLEERISAVSILLCCMQADGRCRNYIAHSAQLTPVLELLHSGNERGRIVTISFLSELLRLSSRSINNQLLQVIKEEGSLSTMHVLLVHLQRVSHEQRPIIAGLLLQLDLLVQPRKGSMYREEAIEALIGALSNKDILVSQVAAAETLVCLGGRFSPSGKPLLELWLLKSVGLEQGYKTAMKEEQQLLQSEGDLSVNREEEERACREWEKRVAGALVNFENGLILEGLGRGMKSQTMALARPCTITITWLMHMLPLLPDTGVQEKARKNLMPEFIRNLKSSKDMEDKALAVLSLHSFIDDSEGLQEIVQFAKDICGPLRQLKRSLGMANNILKKLISSPHVNVPEFWIHDDIAPPTDASANGEVRCLAQARGRIFSGHSDGTLKVWDCRKKNLILIQDLKEHQKSVTCLYISFSGDKLYSGSLDKTIRVWSIGPDEIHFVKSHDAKEPVQSLVVNSTMFCIGAPQSTGVRILQGDTGIKSLLLNKPVQSIAMADGKLLCGCTDNSIQEVDLAGGPPITIQQGVRTLVGKKAVYGLQVFNDKLYSSGSRVDGMAAKVWSLKDRSLAGQLATSLDVRAMVVNDEFIYLGSNSGLIEVWLRERLVKVAGMSIGCKVMSLLAHDNVLFCGSEDGKIRRWAVG